MNANDTPDFLQMTRREIEDYLIERALVDGNFRKRLLNDPENLLRELGLPIGPDVEIQVIEEKPKSFCIVLPRVLLDMEELQDEDLEEISGGAGQSEVQRFFKGYL